VGRGASTASHSLVTRGGEELFDSFPLSRTPFVGEELSDSFPLSQTHPLSYGHTHSKVGRGASTASHSLVTRGGEEFSPIRREGRGERETRGEEVAIAVGGRRSGIHLRLTSSSCLHITQVLACSLA